MLHLHLPCTIKIVLVKLLPQIHIKSLKQLVSSTTKDLVSDL